MKYFINKVYFFNKLYSVSFLIVLIISIISLASSFSPLGLPNMIIYLAVLFWLLTFFHFKSDLFENYVEYNRKGCFLKIKSSHGFNILFKDILDIRVSSEFIIIYLTNEEKLIFDIRNLKKNEIRKLIGFFFLKGKSFPIIFEDYFLN